MAERPPPSPPRYLGPGQDWNYDNPQTYWADQQRIYGFEEQGRDIRRAIQLRMMQEYLQGQRSWQPGAPAVVDWRTGRPEVPDYRLGQRMIVRNIAENTVPWQVQRQLMPRSRRNRRPREEPRTERR